MIASALQHLALAAVGLSLVVGVVAALTVPQFSTGRRTPRFRTALGGAA